MQHVFLISAKLLESCGGYIHSLSGHVSINPDGNQNIIWLNQENE